MSPRRWSRTAGRITTALALFGGVYLYLRIEVMTLPVAGCSPLFGIDPGQRLLLDRKPANLAQGDMVLFTDPSGALHMARLAPPPLDLAPEARAELDAGALWLHVEREDCPAPDSRSLGPVTRSAIEAKIVTALRFGD
ncbi:MAG: hypothetical protein ACYSWX_08785 [Planctomycetota bacterium]